MGFLEKIDLLLAFHEEIDRLEKSLTKVIKSKVKQKILAKLAEATKEKEKLIESLSKDVIDSQSVLQKWSKVDLNSKERKEKGVALLGEFLKMKMDRKSLNALHRRLDKEANHKIVVSV